MKLAAKSIGSVKKEKTIESICDFIGLKNTKLH